MNLNAKFYCVTIDDKDMCWIGNDPYQHQVTEDLEEAHHCRDHLAEHNPKHVYRVREVRLGEEAKCKK